MVGCALPRFPARPRKWSTTTRSRSTHGCKSRLRAKRTNRQDAENAKSWGSDDALDASLKDADVERYEQPKAEIRGFQVRENLREVDGWKVLHRLELHDDAVGNEEIEALSADCPALILDADCHLSRERNAAKGELDAERLLVDGLEEAGPENSMHLDRGPDHPVGKC